MAITVHHSDMTAWLAAYSGPLFDCCITDPPYHLASIVKRFGGKNAAEAKVGATGAYARASRGFMGKEWDGGDIAFQPETWRAVYDALKPGAHLVAFAATRGGHRMACAIEDAGFEIRDCLGWAFGSGFPKSLNVSKKLADSLPADALCACAPDCRQTAPDFQSGYPSDHGSGDGLPRGDLGAARDVAPSQGDALKCNPSRPSEGVRGEEPSHSHSSSSARRSSAGCPPPASRQSGDSLASDSGLCGTPSNTSNVELMAEHKTAPHTPDTQHSGDGSAFSSSDNSGCDSSNLPHCEDCGKIVIPQGLGTSLKPAWEMIYLARKPLSEKSITANVLKHGTGALNIDECRVETTESIKATRNYVPGGMEPGGLDKGAKTFTEYKQNDAGRWPANFCHDGSEEVLAEFPETGAASGGAVTSKPGQVYGNGAVLPSATTIAPADSGGSAARFFYSAKAGPLDRIGTAHATVKPVDLMRWLVRMVTPPGGHILEPFAGSGTTGIAALAEGFDCTMIELEADHVTDIERKLVYLAGAGGVGVIERHKAKIDRQVNDSGPLFGGVA